MCQNITIKNKRKVSKIWNVYVDVTISGGDRWRDPPVQLNVCIRQHARNPTLSFIVESAGVRST
jgi:hypothetical protein